MRHVLRLALAIGIGLVASGAHAKDVCVSEGTGRFVFKKVKALKKPGAIVPLHGVFFSTMTGAVGTMDGTAFVRADGQVFFGLTIHSEYTFPIGLGFDISYTMIGAPDFSADGFHVSDGGGTTTSTWTPIDCQDVVLP